MTVHVLVGWRFSWPTARDTGFEQPAPWLARGYRFRWEKSGGEYARKAPERQPELGLLGWKIPTICTVILVTERF
jgi:hypothetical protein